MQNTCSYIMRNELERSLKINIMRLDFFIKITREVKSILKKWH